MTSTLANNQRSRQHCCSCARGWPRQLRAIAALRWHLSVGPCTPDVCAHNICTYVHAHTHTHTHARTRTHTCSHTHTHTCTHTHTHTHTHTLAHLTHTCAHIISRSFRETHRTLSRACLAEGWTWRKCAALDFRPSLQKLLTQQAAARLFLLLRRAAPTDERVALALVAAPSFKAVLASVLYVWLSAAAVAAAHLVLASPSR